MVVARVSRAERKARTRSALLTAGRELFLREGFHGATLDRVAAEAGFTKGAVYASFPTKADLFLAIFEERADARCAEIAALGERAGSPDEFLELMLAHWQKVMRRERAWSLLLVEFWVHAARDDGLRDRLLALHVRPREATTQALRKLGAGDELAIGVEEMVTGQIALGNGLNLEAFLDPRGKPQLYDRLGRILLDGARR
jgi:AcrR family transcriptional regulator